MSRMICFVIAWPFLIVLRRSQSLQMIYSIRSLRRCLLLSCINTVLSELDSQLNLLELKCRRPVEHLLAGELHRS